jgi:predicted enzyme related to lactoylglutathione lyase
LAKRKAAGLKRMTGMLAHTEFASTDPRATREFLEKVFGWDLAEVKTPTGKIIRYQTPGGARGSIRRTGAKEAPGTINYVLVKDIAATAKRVKRMGGERLMPITDVPHMGSYFWFKVPGGPVLAAWQDAPERED